MLTGGVMYPVDRENLRQPMVDVERTVRMLEETDP
jgi:hypothetical protein